VGFGKLSQLRNKIGGKFRLLSMNLSNRHDPHIRDDVSARGVRRNNQSGHTSSIAEEVDELNTTGIMVAAAFI